jgi:uroporphyrinogen-III synthase
LLITRPREDAESFAAAVRALGIAPMIEPLFEIEPAASTPLDFTGVQAVLLTSRNGARALAAATAQRDIRVYAVGDGSAAAAREAGFGRVLSADGDVDALAAKVIAELQPAHGTLLHVAGKAVAGDLLGSLSAAGFAARHVVLYAARLIDRLSPSCRAALAAGRIDAVAFFSPRTAAAFVRLVRAEALEGTCTAMTSFCLSSAVATEIRPLAWRRVAVADRPNQTALLQLLRNEAEHS